MCNPKNIDLIFFLERGSPGRRKRNARNRNRNRTMTTIEEEPRTTHDDFTGSEVEYHPHYTNIPVICFSILPEPMRVGGRFPEIDFDSLLTFYLHDRACPLSGRVLGPGIVLKCSPPDCLFRGVVLHRALMASDVRDADILQLISDPRVLLSERDLQLSFSSLLKTQEWRGDRLYEMTKAMIKSEKKFLMSTLEKIKVETQEQKRCAKLAGSWLLTRRALPKTALIFKMCRLLNHQHFAPGGHGARKAAVRWERRVKHRGE